jgi:hypothetical protein
MTSYDTSELAKARVLLDATVYALNTPKKRYQFSEFCTKHNFPTFASPGRNNQEYKNLNGEWHILLKRYKSKEDLCKYLEERVSNLTVIQHKKRSNGTVDEFTHDKLIETVEGTKDHVIIPVVEEGLASVEQTHMNMFIPLTCFIGLYLIRLCFVTTV